jgi:hypothetical protein
MMWIHKSMVSSVTVFMEVNKYTYLSNNPVQNNTVIHKKASFNPSTTETVKYVTVNCFTFKCFMRVFQYTEICCDMWFHHKNSTLKVMLTWRCLYHTHTEVCLWPFAVKISLHLPSVPHNFTANNNYVILDMALDSVWKSGGEESAYQTSHSYHKKKSIKSASKATVNLSRMCCDQFKQFDF